MKREDFAAQATAMMRPLYYIACTILPEKADREDALQNCLEKGLRKCAALRDETKFRSWITRILVNECHNIHRKGKRLVLTDTLPEAQAEDFDIALHDAVSSLPDRLRIPFMLRLEGYSVKEVSQILRIPEGTAKHRLSEARAQLRHELDDMKEVLA